MKKRNKKYVPKYVARNPMLTFFGGMSDYHREEAQEIMAKNHMAMVRLATGAGERDDWDRIVGCINMANVMCEQGIGNEFRQHTIEARDALCEVGKRFYAIGKFILKGDELTTLNEALACHDAQVENCRYIDVERAANEVVRRIHHGINSTNVKAEMQKEMAVCHTT